MNKYRNEPGQGDKYSLENFLTILTGPGDNTIIF